MKALVFGVEHEEYQVPEGANTLMQNLGKTPVKLMDVEDARPLGELTAAVVLSPAQAMRDLDQVVVPIDAQRLVARGLPLDRVPLGVSGEGPWGLIDDRHHLLAVYEATETDRIRPAVVVASG